MFGGREAGNGGGGVRARGAAGACFAVKNVMEIDPEAAVKFENGKWNGRDDFLGERAKRQDEKEGERKRRARGGRGAHLRTNDSSANRDRRVIVMSGCVEKKREAGRLIRDDVSHNGQENKSCERGGREHG